MKFEDLIVRTKGEETSQGGARHFAAKDPEPFDRKRAIAFVAAKYLFSIVMICVSIKTTREPLYTLVAFLELVVIALVSDVVVQRFRRVGLALNDIFCLLFNIQAAVLLFGGSYVQLVMLTNLKFLEDLGGKVVVYGLAAVALLVFTFLPITPIVELLSPEADPAGAHWKRVESAPQALTSRRQFFAGGVAAAYAAGLFAFGTKYSPAVGYATLIENAYRVESFKRRAASSTGAEAEDFYRAGVGDYRTKDAELPSNPNVILIFTEGLSQNIVEDERDIMPNLAKLEASSLFFANYYNHSFATLRGLIGQLYSGYQLDDLDQNSLISLQDIFAADGYQTAFINPEPSNDEFVEYLESFKFDELIGDPDESKDGELESYSDKQAYELLYDEATKMNKKGNFFLAMYTFGTHVSFDTTNKKYGDGSDPLLNKFYNLDYQLGKFLEKFNESELAKNTVIVFTADHATYSDSDFAATFPSYTRRNAMIDRVPLCIYYAGMEAEEVDAGGRNSLGLAPTILDYLDLDEPNYFLGTSLFAPEAGEFDTVFCEEATYFQTKGAQIVELGGEELQKTEERIQQYYLAKA